MGNIAALSGDSAKTFLEECITCLSVTEVKYSYRVNMLRTLLRSHHSHPRAPFAHTPLPRATHPSEMVRCTDEGYRIEDSAWSEISEKSVCLTGIRFDG